MKLGSLWSKDRVLQLLHARKSTYPDVSMELGAPLSLVRVLLILYARQCSKVVALPARLFMDLSSDVDFSQIRIKTF